MGAAAQALQQQLTAVAVFEQRVRLCRFPVSRPEFLCSSRGQLRKVETTGCPLRFQEANLQVRELRLSYLLSASVRLLGR